MPKLFYRAAYEAATHEKRPKNYGKVSDSHFEADPSALEEALGWLSDEQLCDAFYADWLLQLHNPGGETQLQVRSLLIGQGALAANYLAELAQNADDAFDGEDGASVKIILEGDWLLVANNGRRVTPGNLRGLCRFFVHRGGKVKELDVATIGRFGIGFKSCYRIASEVLVRSWDSRGDITFRLPICKLGDRGSWADEGRLKRVVEALRLTGASIGDDLLTPDKLGYCTPEFLSALPSRLPPQAAALQELKRGTLFAFHLHPAGATEVRERISGQQNDLYELCPLFLPKVRTVQLGASELTMRVSREDIADGLPGRVSATRVTLETDQDGQKVRDRCWKLVGTAEGDLWQIALHADSQGLLSFKNDDESSFSLREGGAYAFFPLNDANRDFFFRFHLHLNLPTNLSRGDWNAEENENVTDQIGRAISGLSQWLETHSAKRRPDWQIEDLFRREPHKGAVVSHEIFSRLRRAVHERPLLRTLWGGWRRASEAFAVRLASVSTVRRAWRELCEAAHHVGDRFPFVVASDQIDLGIPLAGDKELREFFSLAAQQPDPGQTFWINMLHSVLGAETLSRDGVQEALTLIMVDLRDGRAATVAQLFQRFEGTELVEAWHAAFRSILAWLRDHPRRDLAVFGESLSIKVKRFDAAKFSIEWEEVPTKLLAPNDWTENGERFWSARRPICPDSLRESVVKALRVKHGADLWQPLNEVWLVDSSPVGCFAGVVRPWDRGRAPTSDAQTRARDKLKEWGLWDSYLAAITDRLESGLEARLETITKEDTGSPLRFLFDPAFRNSVARLPTPQLQRLVRSAERAAMRAFLTRHRRNSAATVFFSNRNEDIPFDLRSLLPALLPGHLEAPSWLNQEVWTSIGELGLTEAAGFEFLGKIGAEKRLEMAQEILRRFYRWKDIGPTILNARALAALNEFLSDVRSTWPVGLAANSTAVLGQLFVPSVKADAGLVEKAWECMIAHAGKVEWHVKSLPEPLAKIPIVAAACPGPGSLKLEIPEGGRPIPLERVASEVLGKPEIRAIFDAREWQTESLAPLRLVWKANGGPICEIGDAAFAFHGSRFLVARLAGTPDHDQYRRVLTTYDLHAPEDREFRQALNSLRDGKSAESVYDTFRKRILEVLRNRLVVDEGYEVRHVLRELLQNAESAYASKPGEKSASCPFHVRSEAVAGGLFRIIATHFGRTFNEADAQGVERDDIARIVSLRAERANSPDEIGRFNRGFKSVFMVTANVQVRSGSYDFGIEDLLILHPPEPKPQENAIAETRFSFQCSRPDAQRLFGGSSARGASVFHPASFVFLKHVTEVLLDHANESRVWTLRRNPGVDGWSEVAIQESRTGERERFLTFCCSSKRAVGRRFGIAIRLGSEGQPLEVESAWNRLYLTFPTETSGPCGVLVNADFDTDGGRVDVKHSSINESLIKDAFEALAVRLSERAKSDLSRAEWLGWSKAIAVSEALKWLAATFPRDNLSIRELLASCGQVLLSCVPHDGRLVVPSRLMRELAASSYASSWQIDVSEWLDQELSAEVVRINQEATVRFTLQNFALGLRTDGARGAMVLAALQSPRFQESFKLSAVEQYEVNEAIKLLGSLQAASVQPPLALVFAPGSNLIGLSAAEVVSWWRDNDDPDDYMLDSAVLWPLFGEAGLSDVERRKQLVKKLSAPETSDGQSLWYRVLGFACLLSAGRPVDRVREFWKAKLLPIDFWGRTLEGFHSVDSDFERLIQQEAGGSNASGEDAVFWRRIFYDVRKVQHLICENQFAEEVMAVATSPKGAANLIHFLKTGKLPGEKPWRGVLGQSAGSPLFFTVRELRRLGVIQHSEVDPSAFFVCRPVRRLAARMGWLEPKFVDSYDFESLAESSQRIHSAATRVGTAHAEVFERWFDIPLLHYALNHP